MIKHIVLIKLKDNNDEAVHDVIRKMHEMRNKIDGLESVEVGRNFSYINDNLEIIHPNYNIALTCIFKDKTSFEKYDRHPEHTIVKNALNPILEHVAVVDYEI